MSGFSKFIKGIGDYLSNPENLLGVFNMASNTAMAYKQYKLAEQANLQNYEAMKRANDTNIMLTRETNALQMGLAEKAYQRSLPTQQVANYQAAGMSRAGALGALTGGGTYNPPTLNTAQVSPETQDPSGQIQALGGFMNMFANAQQMIQESKLRKLELKEKQRDLHLKEQYDKISPRLTTALNHYLRNTSEPTYVDFIDSLSNGYSDGKGNVWNYRDAEELKSVLGNPEIRALIKEDFEHAYSSQQSVYDTRVKEMATKIQQAKFPFEFASAPKQAETANEILNYLLGYGESGKPRYLDLYDKEHRSKVLQLEETIEDLEKRYNEVDLSEEQRKWLFLIRSFIGAINGKP